MDQGPAIQASGVPIAVNPSIKSLSATISQMNTSSSFTMMVFYESSNGSYSAVYAIVPNTPADIWDWKDARLQTMNLGGNSIKSSLTHCSRLPDSIEASMDIFAYFVVDNTPPFNVSSSRELYSLAYLVGNPPQGNSSGYNFTGECSPAAYFPRSSPSTLPQASLF